MRYVINPFTGHLDAVGDSGSSGTVTGTGVATRIAFWSGASVLTSDAALYWDDVNKALGIGGITAPLFAVHAKVEGGTLFPGVLADGYLGVGGNVTPTFSGRFAAGTSGAPAALSSGVRIAQFTCRGHDGTSFSGTQGRIDFSATEAWAVGANGTDIGFWTTPNGSTTVTRRVTIGSTGRVGVGVDLPDVLVDARGSGDTRAQVVAFSATDYGYLVARRSRGTFPSTPGAISSGDRLGALAFAGDDGSLTSVYSASIEAEAEQAFTGSAHGTSLRFYTTPLGSTTTTERMRLRASGELLVNSTGAPSAGEIVNARGHANLLQSAGVASELRLGEPDESGWTAFKAQNQGATVTYTLPAAQGAAASLWQNDGSGGLSWAVVSGDATLAAGGALTVANDAISNAKLRNSGALSVIGRSANSSGDPADISASAASDAVLRESGSVLGFGTVATAGIANDAVTYAKMQNVSATSRVLGRITAGAGDVEELTAANLATIANATFDHGTLAGLTDDDHVGYTRLVGRAGTANDTLLSTNGNGSLTGSGDASSSLVLHGNSSAAPGTSSLALLGSAITDLNNTVVALQVLPATLNQAGSGNFTALDVGFNAPSGAPFTWTTTVGFAGAGGARLFRFSPILKNTASSALAIASVRGLTSAYRVRADGAACTQAEHSWVYDATSYDRINAGILTVTAHNVVNSVPSIGAGCTLTTRRGLWLQNRTSTGTQDTAVGLDVEDQTVGTLAAAVRSAVAAGTGKWGILATGAANNSFLGPVVVGAASGTPTNASVGLEVQSTTLALLLPRLTTTQRDALTAVDGMVVYRSTAPAAVQAYVTGAWVNLS